MSEATSITKEALSWLLRDEESGRVVLVDVREKEEFDRGSLEGALHLPLSRIEKEIERWVPSKRARVVLYCAKGVRSKEAQAKLVSLGYRRALSLLGGYDAWCTEADMSALSATERIRYARQIALPSLGTEGQEALRRARVLVVGLGGLGSPVALYLAAAGVGTLGIVDADEVELSNLHRQLIHTTARVGQSKVDSAKKALTELNPHVRVVPHALRFSPESAAALVAEYDVLVDASDNFATRYAVSDAACAAGIPVVHGSVHRLEGQMAVLMPARAALRRGHEAGPCYRCIFPDPPTSAPSCEEAGVLGATCGVVGSLMATEALKLLTNVGVRAGDKSAALQAKLVLYDALTCELRSLAVPKRPQCPCSQM